jgi:hypothetical protein
LILGDGGARRVADCQDISWRHVEGGTEPLGVPAAAIVLERREDPSVKTPGRISYREPKLSVLVWQQVLDFRKFLTK